MRGAFGSLEGMRGSIMNIAQRLSSKTFAIIGLLLLGTSAYPLVLMSREVATGWWVDRNYSLKFIHDSVSASLGDHTVRFEDDEPITSDPAARARTPVRILIDGRDYSSPTEAIVRPYFRDANRYHGFLSLKRVVDRNSGTTKIAVSQALGAPTGVTRSYSPERLRYRVLLISTDGIIEEELFTYAQRGSPAIRARLIAGVVPHPFGYHSDLMQGWPTLLYPVLYPWLSGLIGAGIVILAIARRYSFSPIAKMAERSRRISGLR
jgi:hypothetical protein